MQNENEITLENRGDVTIMDIRGDITAFSDTFLNEAYKKAKDLGTRKIILKSYKDAYINSGGIALLIQLLARMKRNNQKVIIAGISEHYAPEELVGKRVVIVANLKPRKLMGLESQGMVLAASDEDGLAVLLVDRDVAPGSRAK